MFLDGRRAAHVPQVPAVVLVQPVDLLPRTHAVLADVVEEVLAELLLDVVEVVLHELLELRLRPPIPRLEVRAELGEGLLQGSAVAGAEAGLRQHHVLFGGERLVPRLPVGAQLLAAVPAQRARRLRRLGRLRLSDRRWPRAARVLRLPPLLLAAARRRAGARLPGPRGHGVFLGELGLALPRGLDGGGLHGHLRLQGGVARGLLDLPLRHEHALELQRPLEVMGLLEQLGLGGLELAQRSIEAPVHLVGHLPRRRDDVALELLELVHVGRLLEHHELG
mmetsp:Transcript_31142/g.98856  ORF Transcript_31142/g.98856 Transcript_31142/m.98856 type:complete len:279 (-) Transcript_31142:187-1023(-)